MIILCDLVCGIGQLSRYKGGKKWKEIINNASILISKLLKHSEKKNMPDSGDSNKQAGSHQIPLINRLDVHVLDNMNQYRPSDSPNAAISGAYALENDQDDSFEETQTSVVASASSEGNQTNNYFMTMYIILYYL
jgi:hypothetical protein